MTHISKKNLTKNSHKKLTEQMANMFVVADKKTASPLFTSLFTESEQIMFIKRLAVILMIDKRYSKYRIAKTLHVSESTVKLLLLKYEAGLYKPITKLAKSKSFDTNTFWEMVEVLLRAGMPPRGKGRWKSTLQNLTR